MSVATEIDRIKANIASAYAKAGAKGAPLPSVQNSTNLPATIEGIPSGGGGGVTLGEIPEGHIINLNESGSIAYFYVVKHNYEPELNGNGRTLLARLDALEATTKWASTINEYATSTVDSYLNGTYLKLLDTDMQQLVGKTAFYYTPGNENNEVSTLERSVFLLSGSELGFEHKNANVEGASLPILDKLVITKDETQWTRTPSTLNTGYAFRVNKSGVYAAASVSTFYVVRPCFTLPADYVLF